MNKASNLIWNNLYLIVVKKPFPKIYQEKDLFGEHCYLIVSEI